MCGIVGFTGKHQAAPILLDGLSKLEYRGYDSAGIAVRENLFREPVALAIQDGQHTGNRQKPMHILMSATMEMWLPYTTVSSKTIRN